MTDVVLVIVVAFIALCVGIAVGDVLATARANQPMYRRRITLEHTDDCGQIVAERSSEVSWN